MRKAILQATVVTLWMTSPGRASEAPPGETRPAPLVVAAEEDKSHIVFQIGADAFGGGLGGLEFIAGVNATLVFPITDLISVGIRPSLHYAYDEDSEYEITWFHPEVAVHINFCHDPVRLYFVGAGGYSFALDSDLYGGLADGWSALAGIGVAWRPGDGRWGIFGELGWRLAFGSQGQTVVLLDENGAPLCVTSECLEYQTDEVDREYKINSVMVNLGVVFEP